MIRCVPRSEIEDDVWDGFCATSPTAWFRNTTEFLQFTTEMSFDQNIKDRSFGVFDDHTLKALIALTVQPLHANPELYEFGMGGTPIPYPAFAEMSLKDETKLLKIIFSEIDRLAAEDHIVQARFFVDPLSPTLLSGRQRYNPFLKFGGHSTELTTNIIALHQTEEALLHDMARGHRTDIMFAQKQKYTVTIFDKTTITEAVFAQYQNLHLRAAGRKTRPDESWQTMLRWITNGQAILSFIHMSGESEYVSGALSITYQNKAYYGSGATDPDHEKIRGLGHWLQWETMRYLKKQGITHYETGWNYYPIISSEVASPKELAIGHYKSLFGGMILPLWRADKYYSLSWLQQKQQTLIEEFMRNQNKV